MSRDCAICRLHSDPLQVSAFDIVRTPLSVLRHHHHPAPMLGWLLLDTLRHCSGPVDFNSDEASRWGGAVQQASQLVRDLTACDRVYAIAFGEGAQHLHLHLIPRFVADPQTTAWCVADFYRAVAHGDASAAHPDAIAEFVQRAREHRCSQQLLSCC